MLFFISDTLLKQAAAYILLISTSFSPGTLKNLSKLLILLFFFHYLSYIFENI